MKKINHLLFCHIILTLYYFGFNHVPFPVLVGVVSFGIDIACALGVPDGFARVSWVLDWIKDNCDEYVNTCSGRT